MFSKFLSLTLLISATASASYERALKIFGNGSGGGSKKVITELVDGGYYFSAVPWMKDYLVRTNASLDADMEATLDRMLSVTGVKVFESLPEDILKRSRSGNIKYILAKRLMKRGQYQEAMNELNQVKTEHPAYPFVANMKGAIQAQLGNHAEAESFFKECMRSSRSQASEADLSLQRSQFQTNRDFCVAGIARVQFAKQKYKESDFIYLDVPKDSFVWPEILFEEAWTSYYLKNYNRTLGKLVSYKAPVFDFVFKPEVEVLRALTFMKMCLFDDAKKTVDSFYDQLLNPSKELRSKLLGMGKDYRQFYNLIAETDTKLPSRNITETILKSIKKETAFIEMKGALSAAVAEYNLLKKQGKSSLKSSLLRNMQTVLDEYRTIVGAYVRTGMVAKYAELYSAFQGMSYIKLEVLAQRKERLYQTDSVPGRKRGDLRYIERNDKQYFWTFNGEFWADELGDYVFALRSEC